MVFDPEIHHRRSIRLKGYDYTSSGAYFVTVCAAHRHLLYGDVTDGVVRLNGMGNIVLETLDGLPGHYRNVELDARIVMPNHVHVIIILRDDDPVGPVGAGFKPAPTTTTNAKRYGLTEIMRAFKTFSARHINRLRETPGAPVWQRNYYEHIVRGDEELNEIREYIASNPIQWEQDEENPLRLNSYQRFI